MKNFLLVSPKISLLKCPMVIIWQHFDILQKTSLSAYKLQEFVPKQEVVALAVRLAQMKIDNNYQCQNIFSDVSLGKPNSWAC